MPPLTKLVRPTKTINTVDNLVTPSENNLEIKKSLPKSQIHPPQYELEEVEIEQLQTVPHSSEELCGIINQLISKNKVNAKNAFEVPIIEVSSDPLNTPSLSECSWKHFSSTLQNDYKIYGFRVDGYHANAFSMLNLINRQDPAEEELKIKQESFVKEKSLDLEGFYLHLEDERLYTLDLASLSTNSLLFNFKRKVIMDNPSLQNILLNNVGLNSRLELGLIPDSQNQEQYVGCRQIQTALFNLNEYSAATRLFQNISNAYPDLSESQPANYQELWEKTKADYCFQPHSIQRPPLLQQEMSIFTEEQLPKQPQPQKVEYSSEIDSSVSHCKSPHLHKKYLEPRSKHNRSLHFRNGRTAKASRKRKIVEDEYQVEFDERQIEKRFLAIKQSKTERLNRKLNRKTKMKTNADKNIDRLCVMRVDMDWNSQTMIQQSPAVSEKEEDFIREIDVAKTKCMTDVTQRVRWLVQDCHLRNFRDICYQAAIQGQINTSMYFLSVLHLANEIGLNLMQKGEDDFEIQNI